MSSLVESSLVASGPVMSCLVTSRHVTFYRGEMKQHVASGLVLSSPV